MRHRPALDGRAPSPGVGAPVAPRRPGLPPPPPRLRSGPPVLVGAAAGGAGARVLLSVHDGLSASGAGPASGPSGCWGCLSDGSGSAVGDLPRLLPGCQPRVSRLSTSARDLRSRSRSGAQGAQHHAPSWTLHTPPSSHPFPHSFSPWAPFCGWQMDGVVLRTPMSRVVTGVVTDIISSLEPHRRASWSCLASCLTSVAPQPAPASPSRLPLSARHVTARGLARPPARPARHLPHISCPSCFDAALDSHHIYARISACQPRTRLGPRGMCPGPCVGSHHV